MAWSDALRVLAGSLSMVIVGFAIYIAWDHLTPGRDRGPQRQLLDWHIGIGATVFAGYVLVAALDTVARIGYPAGWRLWTNAGLLVGAAVVGAAVTSRMRRRR